VVKQYFIGIANVRTVPISNSKLQYIAAELPVKASNITAADQLQEVYNLTLNCLSGQS
jgi:hypothetical protein